MISIRLICARLFNRNFSTTRTGKLVEKYYYPRGEIALLIVTVRYAILINISGSYLRFILGVRLEFS